MTAVCNESHPITPLVTLSLRRSHYHSVCNLFSLLPAFPACNVTRLLYVLPGCVPRLRQRSSAAGCGGPAILHAAHHIVTTTACHPVPSTQMRRKPSPTSMVEWAHVSGSSRQQRHAGHGEPLTCAHSNIEAGLGFLLICVGGRPWW